MDERPKQSRFAKFVQRFKPNSARVAQEPVPPVQPLQPERPPSRELSDWERALRGLPEEREPQVAQTSQAASQSTRRLRSVNSQALLKAAKSVERLRSKISLPDFNRGGTQRVGPDQPLIVHVERSVEVVRDPGVLPSSRPQSPTLTPTPRRASWPPPPPRRRSPVPPVPPLPSPDRLAAMSDPRVANVRAAVEAYNKDVPAGKQALPMPRSVSDWDRKAHTGSHVELKDGGLAVYTGNHTYQEVKAHERAFVAVDDRGISSRHNEALTQQAGQAARARRQQSQGR
jgi:hypothetical protein